MPIIIKINESRGYYPRWIFHAHANLQSLQMCQVSLLCLSTSTLHLALWNERLI